MKTLSESLFDVDVATKSISWMDIIIEYIKRYPSLPDHHFKPWEEWQTELSNDLGYKADTGINILRVSEKYLFVRMNEYSVILIGYGLLPNSSNRAAAVIDINYAGANPKLQIKCIDPTDQNYMDALYRWMKGQAHFQHWMKGQSHFQKYAKYPLSQDDKKKFIKDIIQGDCCDVTYITA